MDIYEVILGVRNRTIKPYKDGRLLIYYASLIGLSGINKTVFINYTRPLIAIMLFSNQSQSISTF